MPSRLKKWAARLLPTETEGAWQIFDEKTKGSIEAGKLADFTILAGNSLTVSLGRIKDIQVEEVIIGGKSAYKAT